MIEFLNTYLFNYEAISSYLIVAIVLYTLCYVIEEVLGKYWIETLIDYVRVSSERHKNTHKILDPLLCISIKKANTADNEL